MRHFRWVLLVLPLFAMSCNPPTTAVQLPNAMQTTHAENKSPAFNHPTNSESDTRSDDGEASLAIFKKRILPILQASNPSSCAECHLSGVDLKDYIHPSQEKTFASLVKGGLVDVNNPDASKLLKFIERRPEKPSLVGEEARKQEYEAFRAWIHAAVGDSLLATTGTADEAIGPNVPDEVIRHARKDRVIASFVENVWTEVGRCAACHSPDRNQEQVKKHGEQVSWITLRDPQATLDYMLEAGLVDSKEPEKSLLLLKPTQQVKHGGGQKMVTGDRSYKQFRRFLDDYAAVVQGKYQTATDLPAPNDELSETTDIWLKIAGIPAQYDKMLLQVDLYSWEKDDWSKFRVATSDRPVFGAKKLWQHSLSLTVQRGSPWASQLSAGKLPAGKYLVKIYIDQTNKLQRDFTAKLGDDDLVGQIEIESSWPVGYGQMTTVNF